MNSLEENMNMSMLNSPQLTSKNPANFTSLLSDASSSSTIASQQPLLSQINQIGSHSRFNTSNLLSGTHQSRITSDQIRYILQNASQETLFSSGNTAFMRMLQDRNALKASLETSRAQYNELLNRIPNPSDVATPKSAFPLPLNIALPPAPKQSDYPNVPYWYQKDWKAQEDRIKHESALYPDLYIQSNLPDATCTTLSFITHTDGHSVTNSEAEEIRISCKTIWNTLASFGHAPATWTNATTLALQYFHEQMYLRHPITRLCQNDWKLRALGIKDYSGWIRHPSRQAQIPTKLQRASIKRSSSPSLEGPMCNSKKIRKTSCVPEDTRLISTSDGPSETSLISKSLITYSSRARPISKTKHQDKVQLPSHVEPVLQHAPASNPASSCSTTSNPAISSPAISLTSTTPTSSSPVIPTSSISTFHSPTIPVSVTFPPSTIASVIQPSPFASITAPAPTHQNPTPFTPNILADDTISQFRSDNGTNVQQAEVTMTMPQTNIPTTSSIPSAPICLQDPFASRRSSRSSGHTTVDGSTSSDPNTTPDGTSTSDTDNIQSGFPAIAAIVPSLGKAFTVNAKTCSELNLFGQEYLRMHPSRAPPTRDDLKLAYSSLPQDTKELYKQKCREIRKARKQ